MLKNSKVCSEQFYYCRSWSTKVFSVCYSGWLCHRRSSSAFISSEEEVRKYESSKNSRSRFISSLCFFWIQRAFAQRHQHASNPTCWVEWNQEKHPEAECQKSTHHFPPEDLEPLIGLHARLSTQVEGPLRKHQADDTLALVSIAARI